MNVVLNKTTNEMAGVTAMAFIWAQNVVYDDNGIITSGSASVAESVYGNFGKSHSKRITRENLGKVVYLAPDKKSGIFLSPTRGLTEYDAKTDTFNDVNPDDSRLKGLGLFPEPQIHTVFGDTYLLLKNLEKNGMMAVFNSTFSSKKTDLERAVVHCLHSICKDGSKITCDSFFIKSFISYLFPDIPEKSLASDSYYFNMMGDDAVKVAYFKAFVQMMRKKHPDFGKGCYVDSTPLPNDAEDNPFNALCSHGVGGTQNMMRLAIVLDQETGYPVWYEIIPGNVVDMNTLKNIMDDVLKTLDIEITNLVLDAGYTTKELLTAFPIGADKTFIARMPARKGYPFKALYDAIRKLYGRAKYEFSRGKHMYFGNMYKRTIQGVEEYAYVFIDKYNAEAKFSTYLNEHDEEEFHKLPLKEQDWISVKGGYFVLLSNKKASPKEILQEYFERMQIESFIKTSKEYLDLLPISKWTNETVRGKILSDIISTTVLLMLRKDLHDTSYSTTEVFGKGQSLMCFLSKGTVTVETPNTYVKKYYKALGVDVPTHLKVFDMQRSLAKHKL